MRILYTKILSLWAFMGLVRNPLKTENVFKISDSVRRQRRGEAEEAMKAILENEHFQNLWKTRYDPRTEIEALRVLPEGTFGKAVATFLDKNGFTLNGFPKIDYQHGLDYLATRVRQQHDLWHVLTGYEATVTGEMELQAFGMAQLKSPLSVMIIAAGLLHFLIYRPSEVPQAFEAVHEAYLRGKQSKTLLLVHLEEYWSVSLDEVRDQLGLIR